MQHPGAYGTNEVDSFVEAIAWIVVRIIKNTWGVYNDVLGDSRTTSSFFEWCKEQVEGPSLPSLSLHFHLLFVGRY
jgi:hypothetical protein